MSEIFTSQAGGQGLDASGNARWILIVEDDEASRYGLKSLLDSEGYRVTEAASLAGAEVGEAESHGIDGHCGVLGVVMCDCRIRYRSLRRPGEGSFLVMDDGSHANDPIEPWTLGM